MRSSPGYARRVMSLAGQDASESSKAWADLAEELRREIIEAAACETLLRAHRRAVLRQDEQAQAKLASQVRHQTTSVAQAEHKRIEAQALLGDTEEEILQSMPPYMRPMFEALFEEKGRLKNAMQVGAKRNRILFSRLRAVNLVDK